MVRSREADEGFTLIEVLVAILIIGTMLLVLLGVSSGALAVQETARRQQVAAGIANEVMERIRSLAFSDIEAGTGSGAIAGDPHLVLCEGDYRLVQCEKSGGLGELVMTTSSAAAVDPCPPAVAIGALPGVSASNVLPLRPTNCTLYLLNGVEYRARAYVTSTVARSVTKKDSPYRVTVIVDWADHGETRSTTLQSMVWAPRGCLGAATTDLVSGPCGLVRTTDYDFSRGASVVIGFCTPPTCGSVNPSIEVRLGYLALTWTETSGDVSVTAALTPVEVVTVNGATVTAVALSTAAGPDSLVADNLESTTTGEEAGPQYPGRGVATSPFAKSAAFACATCSGTAQNTQWELRAYLIAPASGACPGLPLACGALEANVGEGGLCASGGMAAPCVAGAATFAEVEVSVCRTTPTATCTGYVVARVGGGTMSGSLTDQGNTLSAFSATARIGFLGTLGSAEWIAAGTYDGIASNAVLQTVSKQETSLYRGTPRATAACVGLASGFTTLSNSNPQRCFYRSPLQGDAVGSGRSPILQIGSLTSTSSTLSGKWLYGEYDGSSECLSSLTSASSSSTIFDSIGTGGGGVVGKQGTCPQVGPALNVTLRFPSLSANDLTTTSTGKWYGW